MKLPFLCELCHCLNSPTLYIRTVQEDLFAPVQSDGLAVAEVGAWAEEKHRLLSLYASMFAKSMRGKWGELIYLDLFAGPGRWSTSNSKLIYRSSPTIVLGLDVHFDSYIFADSDAANADVLRRRVEKDAPARRAVVLSMDANANVDQVLRLIPRGSSGNRVLSFCFLDPYRMNDLKFTTIERLSERRMDFLVLIPSGMDANRNEHVYSRDDKHVLDEFLGDTSWRTRWTRDDPDRETFEKFVVQEFSKSMARLGYIAPHINDTATIRSHDKNLLLYRLALYSKHPLGDKFWKQARKYADPQMGMDF